ncbi:MAG: acyl-CoA synthetase [Planctomycetia bacterium]|nr:acyl-CoA synthetase [Planctomycetia bacterium]
MSLLAKDCNIAPLNGHADPWAAIPARYNLGHALTAGNVAAGRGEQVALVWENSAGECRRFTYAELDELSSRFAAALTNLGVQRGDRVLLRLPNLPEFYIAVLGIAKLGAIFIPSSTQFRAAEIAYRLTDSAAVAAITTPELAGELETANADAPALKHLIVTPYNGHRPGTGQLDFWELIASIGDDFSAADFVAADTASDDVAFIAYTSGTTGDPKGVVHYHRYPISYDSLIREWHDYRDGDVAACPAEVGWLLPVACTFLYSMRVGITSMLYHPLDGRFEPRAWFDLIERHGITNFVGTPTMYRMLTADPHVTDAQLTSLRHGVSAGEPLPPDTISSVQARLGFTPLDGIGMSECMVYCYNRAGVPSLAGSCGHPAPGCVIRLVDEQLNDVPPGEEGVLVVRRDSHPGMMREYWNKPEQTAEIFRGQWYYSGDVLTRDDDGRFWFQGRADDVINASGYRISPFEVECCLVEHPAVLEAAVVESPDALRGMVVKAFVVPRQGIAPTAALSEELQAWVKERLAPYKYPRQVEFAAALPKTTSGKIRRRVLREAERQRAAEQVEHRQDGAHLPKDAVVHPDLTHSRKDAKTRKGSVL